MLKGKLSKEQWVALLDMGEPWIYDDIKQVLKWWRFKQEYQREKTGKIRLESLIK